MTETTFYYKIATHDRELLAIHTSNGMQTATLANERVCKELNTNNWCRMFITQAEYETFQAFGIKEIKL